MLRALDRKLLRDLWRLRGQAIAIGAVMAVGLAMFVAYLSTFASLQLTQQAYYERYRFADVFATVRRAPLSLRSRLEGIAGVARVDLRVVADVTLDLPTLVEPATGRLVSIPVPHVPVLDDVFLRRGRYPEPGRPDEVLVSEGFALAHRLGPGSIVPALINGRRRPLQVVGVALSPEYVYTVRPGDVIPDASRFGIIWMAREALGAAFDMEGAFNDVTMALAPGASEPAVLAAVDDILRPWGGLGAIPSRLQISNWSLSNELDQLRGFGLIVPAIFLAVAAFLLNVVLTRIVAVQREQIAALKALGYSSGALGWHYVTWSLVVGAGASVTGLVAGAWMGGGIIGMYNDYFRFPILLYRMPPAVAAAAVAISLVASALGALGAVRRAVRLPPAEAMRPEPPARYRASLVERLGLGAWLGPAARMVVRNLERQPLRAATSIIGVALSAALLVVGLFFVDAMAEMIRVQFDLVQRQDVTVALVEPRGAQALHDLARLPGVVALEPMRVVAARLHAAQRSRQVAITGLPADPMLHRVVDVSGHVRQVPVAGLVLSRALADALQVRAGDGLDVELLEGRRRRAVVPVAGVVDEYLGLSAYMSQQALAALAGEGPVVSGAHLRVDPQQAAILHRRLKVLPAVAGVALTEAMVESFDKTLGETMGVMIAFNVLFAGIIAFGVAYNAARVSLSERSRELASLRVLGFTRGEISAILLGELAVVTLLAVPIGLLIGYGLAWVVVTAFQTEMYRFPLAVAPRTFAIAAAVAIAASALSGLVVRRQLDHLDLVGVLKTRE
ncbi:permease [Luteitalea sp. TBR-22]|uniref:ABC transporter permease n=1 Tax=Luteitalea sp. TBR-22 TaxID=2802971 RepID=UPI001AFB6D0B|nr:ABC transporter permease [Luteitalea sp. TBR-22]BCS34790.1 permease [Luteitalea sp. TBR-22]